MSENTNNPIDVDSTIESWKAEPGSVWTDAHGNLYSYRDEAHGARAGHAGIYAISREVHDHLWELVIADDWETTRYSDDVAKGRMEYAREFISESGQWTQLDPQEVRALNERIDSCLTAEALKETPYGIAVDHDGDLIRWNPAIENFETLENNTYRDGWVPLDSSSYSPMYTLDEFIDRWCKRYGAKEFLSQEEFEARFSERPETEEWQVDSIKAIFNPPQDGLFLTSHKKNALYATYRNGNAFICPVEKALRDNPVLSMLLGLGILNDMLSPKDMWERELFMPMKSTEHAVAIMDAQYAPYEWVDGDGNVVGKAQA